MFFEKPTSYVFHIMNLKLMPKLFKCMKFCNELSCYMRNAFSNRYLYGGVKLSLVFLMAGTLQVGAVEYSSGTDLSLNNSDAFLVIKERPPGIDVQNISVTGKVMNEK